MLAELADPRKWKRVHKKDPNREQDGDVALLEEVAELQNGGSADHLDDDELTFVDASMATVHFHDLPAPIRWERLFACNPDKNDAGAQAVVAEDANGDVYIWMGDACD